MKIPKIRKKYCPKCKKHTEHKVLQSKKGRPSTLKKGSKHRMKKRGEGIGFGNQGKLSKGALTKWKRYGKKSTKKTDLRFFCRVCNTGHTQKKGIRAKKVEFK